MGKATTTKRINNAQLLEHLGASVETMIVRGAQESDDEKEIEAQGIGDAALAQKLETYVFDPEYGLPEGEKDLRAIRAKCLAVLSGTEQFTPAQIQRAIARLILRELGEDG